MDQFQSLNSSRSLPLPAGVDSSVFYVCVSIPALQNIHMLILKNVYSEHVLFNKQKNNFLRF